MLRLSRRAVKGDFAEWTAFCGMAKTPLFELRCSGAQTGAAAMAPNKTNLGYAPELEFAIQEELSVLGSIEARYTDELARLEQSNTSGSAKERLHQQLEFRRKSAREPHVLKLAELRQRLLAETLWRGETRH
jgi:hypothetical protein